MADSISLANNLSNRLAVCSIILLGILEFDEAVLEVDVHMGAVA
jgi:hypothetical protein